MVLLITYDLNNPGRNYQPFYDEIKKAGYWWHHLDSAWIIKTSDSSQHWYNRLAPYLEPNDNILIIELKREYWGSLNKRAWDWLKARFDEEGS